MSFWYKMKDFIGVEDDYYDEDEFTDEEISSLSNYDEDEIDESLKDTEIIQREDVSYKDYSNQSSNDTVRRAPKRSYGTKGDMTVSIREPLTYEDGKLVMDDILAGKVVVLNLEMLEMDKKTQVFYFVSGGVYSLSGSVQNVTKDIYVLVPEGVKIDGKLKEDIKDKTIFNV